MPAIARGHGDTVESVDQLVRTGVGMAESRGEAAGAEGRKLARKRAAIVHTQICNSSKWPAAAAGLLHAPQNPPRGLLDPFSRLLLMCGMGDLEHGNPIARFLPSFLPSFRG